MKKCINVDCLHRQVNCVVCGDDLQAVSYCGIRKDRVRWNEPAKVKVACLV